MKNKGRSVKRKRRIFRRYYGTLTIDCEALDAVVGPFGPIVVVVFMKLVASYLELGPLPDGASLAKVAGLTADEWDRVRVAVLGLFEKGADGRFHREDLDGFIEKSAAARARGVKAITARWDRHRAAKELASSARNQPASSKGSAA